MAINPQAREDLLVQATAYNRRLLLRLPVAVPWLEPIESNEIASIWCREFATVSDWELFLGWRKSGGWSVYFGVQPVLQFNAQNQLRRLYAGGERYVAEGGRLKLLKRNRLGGHVRFEKTLLEPQAEHRVREACLLFLRETADLLGKGKYTFKGQHPSHEHQLVEDASLLLASAGSDLRVANAPHAAS